MNDRVPIPWWRIGSVALLGIAIGIATANGRVWDAVIIGILLLVGLILVGVVLYFRWKAARGDITQG